MDGTECAHGALELLRMVGRARASTAFVRGGFRVSGVGFRA